MRAGGVAGEEIESQPRGGPIVTTSRGLEKRRVAAITFLAVAFGETGVLATVTVSPLIAVDLTGSAALSGLPLAVISAGSALGAVTVSAMMARHGRRFGLIVGYGGGTIGGLIAVVAVATQTFPLFLLAALLVGIANSAVLQARYVVTDLYPAGQRTTMLSMVLWAGAIGAGVGPNSVEPAAKLALRVGFPSLTGGLMFVTMMFGVCMAMCLVLRNSGGSVATSAGSRSVTPRRPWKIHLTSPVIIVAVTAMVVGQWALGVFGGITPLYVSASGNGLRAVGVIMSSHLVGMYLLVPIAGWMADHAGHVPVIVTGLVLLACGGIAAAAAPVGSVVLLSAALFLVGVGWSLEFVSASGLLARGASYVERARTQGAVDTLVLTATGLASVSAGVLMVTTGFATLSLLVSALVALPIIVISRNRGAVRLMLEATS